MCNPKSYSSKFVAISIFMNIFNAGIEGITFFSSSDSYIWEKKNESLSSFSLNNKKPNNSQNSMLNKSKYVSLHA